MSEEERIHRGLKGVYFDRSPATFIDGQAGELLYYGYSIHDLAQYSTFEETAYLLLYGELPVVDELFFMFEMILNYRDSLQPLPDLFFLDR